MTTGGHCSGNTHQAKGTVFTCPTTVGGQPASAAAATAAAAEAGGLRVARQKARAWPSRSQWNTQGTYAGFAMKAAVTVRNGSVLAI